MRQEKEKISLRYYRSQYQEIRNLGVLCAWEWETVFVSQGEGTRQWTLAEQKELLETGHIKWYSGHHMYPASAYPQWADSPENIQFLRLEHYGNNVGEHAHVHQINEKNVLAGYYDVRTGRIIPFNGHPPRRETFPLEESYIEKYRKEHDISEDEAIMYFLKVRTAFKRKIEQMIANDGIEKAFKLYSKSPFVINYIVYMKLKAEEDVWKKESELVKEGKGTRQWSLLEQEELLSYGKITGYVPHHIQTSFMAPQYAGNVDNVQLLTEAEHNIAHGSNLRSWSKGYYNPISKEVESITGEPQRPIFELQNKFIQTKRYKMLFDNPYIEKMITTTRVDASHLVNSQVQD